MNFICMPLFGLGLTTSLANADVIIPLAPDRSVSAHTTAECKGTVETTIASQDLGPFDEAVFSLQICDEVGTVAMADAEQSSVIGETMISGLGAAQAGGEGPAGLHAFSSSLFELGFAIEIPCRYHAVGEVSVGWGLPGGHQASVELIADAATIFAETLNGDGGPIQTAAFESSGILIDGGYTLIASAFISPADLVEQLPFPTTNYGVVFEIFSLGDINLDGAVNTQDLLLLLGAWGECPVPPDACLADLNGDGMVTVLDVLVLLADWQS